MEFLTLMKAVAIDLAEFAYHSLFHEHRSHSRLLALPTGIHEMPGRIARLALGAPGSEDVLHTLHQKALDEVFEIPPIAPQRNTVVYVATTDAPLRTSHAVGVDNILRRIPYGAMLVALLTENGWVRVFHRGTEGWVAIDDIVDKAAYVYPRFIIGEGNAPSDPNTERVRAMIYDTFSCGEGDIALQAEEYVLYKLTRAGATIAWPESRPRVPGAWAELLKDTALIADEPKQRAVMEWTLSHGGGHLAFVEAVFPDGSIQISEANWPDSGIYNERVIVRDEWTKLSPRFIIFP